MKCPKCKTTNQPRAQFCEECGEPLQAKKAAPGKGVHCPSCGEPIKELGATFCENCGAVLTDKKGPKEKTGKIKYISRDERYRLARQLAVESVSGTKEKAEAAPIIYIGEKIV